MLSSIFFVIGILCTCGFILYSLCLYIHSNSVDLNGFQNKISHEVCAEQDGYIIFTLVSKEKFEPALFVSTPLLSNLFLEDTSTTKPDTDGKYRACLGGYADSGHKLTFVLADHNHFEIESVRSACIAEKHWWDKLLKHAK
jgi:hypothetical protein